MLKRKVCVVTGTRAEYGLLRWVIEGICESRSLELQLIATGMHLSPEFGSTYKEIEKDGYVINRKVEMLLSGDTAAAVTKSIGVSMISFADAFDQLRPDVLLILGDRYEVFSAAVAAMIARIPIAHIHGGEATEGLIDEAIRHSITKMSHLHFVAAEEYRERVIQLGEQPKRVFCVGGLGVDTISKTPLMELKALEKALDFKLSNRNLLITYHPVTLEKHSSAQQFNELLYVLSGMRDVNIIFTLPNADTEGRIIIKMINDFVKQNPCRSKAYTSLGQCRYLSCLKFMDAVVGNSSSGLLEAPTFSIGTINIGDRQKGRIEADSVINCYPERDSIEKAFKRLYSKEFQKELPFVKNPYGEPGASEHIIHLLEAISDENLLKKSFYNLKKI